MVFESTIIHEIKPSSLEFRSKEFEGDFAEDFISRSRSIWLRLTLYLLIVCEYVVFVAIELEFSETSTNAAFRIASCSALSFFVLTRLLVLFERFPLRLKPHHVEVMDQFLFLSFCVVMSLCAAYSSERQVAVFLFCILQGPVLCPGRFRHVMISQIAALGIFIACSATVGNASSRELGLLVAAGVSSISLHGLGLMHSEIKVRESFLLHRQMKKDYEENMRLASECLRQEQAKNRLVNVISHELRTPCQAISAMSSLLLESPALNEPDRESASIIQRGSDLLCGIVNDFLEMSRLESDQISFKKEPVDLAEAIEDTFDMVSHSLYNDGRLIEAVYTIDPDIAPSVISDMQRIKQMLLNLIANGVKFCNSGRIHVFISLSSPFHAGGGSASIHSPSQNGGPSSYTPSGSSPPSPTSPATAPLSYPFSLPHSINNHEVDFNPKNNDTPTFTVKTKSDLNRPMLCISVSDTGIGLALDHLPRVFQEFYMVDDGPGKKFSGAGLGLAIVRRTAVGMGGTVQVSSRGLGAGSTFRVFIPYVPSPPIATPRQHSLSATSAMNNNGLPCSVLFVNSDEEARESTRQMIAQSLQYARIADFSSLARLSSFLLDHGDSIVDQPGVTIILIDSNAIRLNLGASGGTSENLRSLIEQSRSLQTAEHRFEFILASPLQDGFEDTAALHALGFSSKIPKPIRRKALIKELNRVRGGDSQSPTSSSALPSASTAASLYDRRKSTAPIAPLASVSSWMQTAANVAVQHAQHAGGVGAGAAGTTGTQATQPLALGMGINLGTGGGGGDAETSSLASEPPTPSLLIVDDNKIIQRALNRMLGSSFQCHIANDGQEAIDMVNQKHYDCILMDFHMDVMDGVQATRLIRSRTDEKKHIPIIGLSADGLDSTVQSAREAGMNTFLVKPVQKSDLLSTINKMLGKN